MLYERMNFMAKNITEFEFETEVMGSDVPVLVDFWAEWCGPCKRLAPTIDEISREVGGSAKVFKVNVDSEGRIAEFYGIMSIPTLIIFKNGEEQQRLIGARPKDEILSELQKYID